MAGAEYSRDLEVMLGDPKRAVLMMTLPLILSYAIAQVNMFADTAWCAGLGSSSSTALSTIIPYYWIIVGIGTGIGIGAAASIARHLGRGESDEAESLVIQTLALSIIVGLVITVPLYLSLDPLMDAMSAGDVAEHCREYIVPIIFSSVIFVLNGAVAGLLRAEGAARKSMVMLIMAAIPNMILDPILIYGAGLGLTGAGIATSVSALISTMLGLYWFLSGRMYLRISFRGFRIRWDQFRDVLAVGFPRMVEVFFICFLSIVQRIILIPKLGVMSSAMYNVPWSFVNLVIVISQAAGAALVPVCSAALGARDADKAEEAFRYISKISLISMSAIALVILIFADWFVIPLSMDESLEPYRDIYAYGLRVYMLSIPFLALIDLGGSLLQALRRARFPMYTAFLRNIVLILLITMCTTMEEVFWSVFAIEVLGGSLNYILGRWFLARFRRYRCGTNPTGA